MKGAVQAVIHEIKFEPSAGVLCIAEVGEIVCCSMITGTSTIDIDDRNSLLCARSDGTFSLLTDDVIAMPKNYSNY